MLLIPHSPHNGRSTRMAMPFSGLTLTLLLLLYMGSPTCSCNAQEKGSLLWFLSGISRGGEPIASWRNDTDCCVWEGITCDQDGLVIAISLASRGLEGRISPSLANLTRLRHLNLSHNSITGGLPSELMLSGSIVELDVSFNSLSGNLKELTSSTPDRLLQVLNISSNLFTGEFPSKTWEKTMNLVAINASNNSFTGQIPSSFCISSLSFEVLDLSYNQFSGTIPTGLGKCSALRVLKAGHNNLNGTLPDELFNATLLENLSLQNNVLEGKLDDKHVIKLRNLAVIDIEGNNFTGNIPGSIGQLKILEELHFNDNNMSGELPPSLGRCTYLKIIDLKGNNFKGQLLQVNFSTLHNLKILDLMMNNFSAEIPESIYSCINLTTLRLSSNNFNGQLPPGIGDLKSLSFLSLANNAFVNITNTLDLLKNSRNLTVLLLGNNFIGEVMPQDGTFDGFQSLRVLSIEYCSLSGSIPLWLSKFANLEILDLSDNQLTGSVPAWINNLNLLYYLDLSNNSLTGELPTALMEIPVLQSREVADHLDPWVFDAPYKGPSFLHSMFSAVPAMLNLGNNKITGNIPLEIGQLKALQVLNLSSNNLSGEIPQAICNLITLQVVDFSRNHLTGKMDKALNQLNFLVQFNVSYNDLEGPIPTGGQFDTFVWSSFYGNPKLCGAILARACHSAETPAVSIPLTKQTFDRTVFVIAFSAFFGVGVLYDQLVLSRYFC